MRDSTPTENCAEDRVALITSGPLRSAIFSLAIPAMGMMLGNLLFEIIDMFWIGMTNPEGIAAVSVASYIIWAFRSVANVTSGGTTTLVSRCAGARKWERLAHWFWRGLLLALIISLASALAGISALSPILGFMGLAEEVEAMSRGYLMVFYVSLPLVFLFMYFDGIFRSIGDTFTPAAVTVFALALNAVLDPFLIFGWLSAPALGVQGAAIATAFSQAAGVVVFIWRLKRANLFNPSLLRNTGIIKGGVLQDLALIGSIGAPLALTGAVFSTIYILLTGVVSEFGTVQIAAMGIGQRWEGLAYFAALAASTAVATVVGQNLGAGNPGRAREAAIIAMKYLLAFTFPVSLLFIFGGQDLASILTRDAEVIEAAGRYLWVIGIFELAMALELGLEGAFIGSGNTLPPFLISVPLTAARFPVAWFLVTQMGLGIEAVWWTISVSTLLKGVLMGVWFLRGRWLKKGVGG